MRFPTIYLHTLFKLNNYVNVKIAVLRLSSRDFTLMPFPAVGVNDEELRAECYRLHPRG